MSMIVFGGSQRSPFLGGHHFPSCGTHVPFLGGGAPVQVSSIEKHCVHVVLLDIPMKPSQTFQHPKSTPKATKNPTHPKHIISMQRNWVKLAMILLPFFI